MNLKVITIGAVLMGIGLSVAGCTDNERAKYWGGTMTIDLPCDQKLFDVTWKDANLWYTTRAMHPDEVPERYTFKEDSTFGAVQGTVHLAERGCKK